MPQRAGGTLMYAAPVAVDAAPLLNMRKLASIILLFPGQALSRSERMVSRKGCPP